MNLTDYTTQTGFLPHLKCGDLAEAVSALVGVVAAAGTPEAAADLVQEVMRREREGSTAVGGGLVIPHARFAGVADVRIAVATLLEPLDVGAADGQPADVVMLLVGPLGDPRLMLRVLARLARLVRQGRFLDDLRAAQSPADLGLAFAQAEQSHS
jgi:PTS system nitrogen regulatory IIA component